MIGGHRTAVVALLGICVAVWCIVPAQMPAQSRPVDVIAVQGSGPISPEPPLAEGVVPGAPGAPGSRGTTAIVDPPVPVVSIRVRVPATATAGQELTYHIYVDNTTQATAHHVEVRASVPTFARVVSVSPKAEPVEEREPKDPTKKEMEYRWPLGTLEARGSKEITLTVVPDGTGEVRTTARVSYEHGQTVITHLNKPLLHLRISGPKEGTVNSTLKYVLDIVNDGSAVAENVVVTNPLEDGLKYASSTPNANGENPLRWEFPSLAPAQKQRIEYDVIPTKVGSFVLGPKIIAKGDFSDSKMVTVKVGQPKLAVTMTGPKLEVPGHPFTYTIAVKNNGDIAAANVEISNGIPQNFHPDTRAPLIEFLSATNNGRYERPDVRWRLGTLPPGESRDVQLTVRANQFGRYVNRANVRSDQTLLREAMTIIVDPNKPLTLNVERAKEVLQVGGDVLYTVRVINSGNNPLDGVALKLDANNTVQFLDPRGATNGRLDLKVPSVQFETLPSPIPPGEIREFSVLVRPSQAGEVKFLASVAATTQLPNGVKQEDTAKIVVAPPPPP